MKMKSILNNCLIDILICRLSSSNFAVIAYKIL